MIESMLKRTSKMAGAGRLLAKGLVVGAVFMLGTGFSADANAGGYKHHRHHGYHGHGGGHYYRGHRRHRSHRGAYLAGGLILGSLITHAYHRNQEPVVVRREVVREPAVTSGRRLFRDRDGNCFERTTSRYGDELLVELDPRECAW